MCGPNPVDKIYFLHTYFRMSLIITRFKLLFRFITFYWKANTVYGLHSPFVYELCQQILHDNRTFYAYPIIESLRGQLLKSKRAIEITDLGAGSKVSSKKVRSVSSIAKYGAISPEVGRMLFRLVNHFKPENILELGTSLGISTLYQSSAALNAKVITIEGCPNIADLASRNFKHSGMRWIQTVNASFEIALPEVLDQLQEVGYVFIDGDHQSRATIKYFDTIFPYLNDESLIVVADIYWSDEMVNAWNQLQQHPQVTLSIDFYHFGILFFRKEQQQKVHYKVVSKWWKPWCFLTKV